MSLASAIMIVVRTKGAFIVEYSFWKCVGILKENVSETVLTLMSKKVISVSFCVCWILVKLKIMCTITYCGIFFSIYLLLVLFHGQLLTSELSFRSVRISCLRLWTCFLNSKKLLTVTFLDQCTVGSYNDEEPTTVCKIVLWKNVLEVRNKN